MDSIELRVAAIIITSFLESINALIFSRHDIVAEKLLTTCSTIMTQSLKKISASFGVFQSFQCHGEKKLIFD
jgi:hypothetical protein